MVSFVKEECDRFIVTIEDIAYYRMKAESEICPQKKEEYFELVDELETTFVILQSGPTPLDAKKRIALLESRTGKSTLECKKALYLNKNDIEEAYAYLIHE